MSRKQSRSEIRMHRALHRPLSLNADVQRMPHPQRLLMQERTKLRQRVQTLARDLENARLELGEFARNLVSVQEEERRRIACELHDGLGQCDKAIAYYNQTLRSDPDNISALVNQAALLATSPVTECRNGKRSRTLAARACERTHFQALFRRYPACSASGSDGRC